MADTSQWIRTYLADHQNPAEVARAMNALAAERGLPMAHPDPAPHAPVRGVRLGHSILAHPALQAAWDERAGGVRAKPVPVPQLRRSATGRARRRGGDS